MPDFKLKNVTWRLHEQRGRIHENVELRRKYVEQSRAHSSILRRTTSRATSAGYKKDRGSYSSSCALEKSRSI